jgi:1-acyl-sn-glycerol-3-phosphate acyltransferase
VGLFPEGITTEGDTLHRFHSSLFEPAVANGAPVHPVAIRYEHPDGSLCRAVSFVGERTFMQSMGLIIRQRAVLARVSFAPPLATREAARRDVARETQRTIATLLGLEDPRSWPERGVDRRGAPR